MEAARAIAFPEDTEHAAYDPAAVQLFWAQLKQAARLVSCFRSAFLGKVSPVHFFWGSFDLACTRFSGRSAPRHPGGVPNCPDWVTLEGYSAELSSCGFCPGGGEEGAFYSYAYPEPAGYRDCPVTTNASYYSTEFGQFLLPHEAVRTAADPDQLLLGFLQATYTGAAELAGWDRSVLERDPEAEPTCSGNVVRASTVETPSGHPARMNPLAAMEVAMPAVSVDNVLALPRIPPGDPAALPDRPVRSVTTAPSGFEGEGFPVRRAFAGVSMRDLDPFIHLDQMGEVDYAPGEPKGTPWHPHRGFETVTYLIDGIFDHQDSHGGGGRITNGDTQWMTAGAGILHIEAPPEQLVVSGGLFHGVQLWVNLPRVSKWNPPRYQDIRGREAALLSSDDGGALLRIIAGEVAGYTGPGSTFTPMNMVHATVSPGATVTVPWPVEFNALAYVLAGQGAVSAERRPISSGQLAVFGAGDTLTVSAAARQDSASPNLEVILLGGQPIREPVVHYGPFVMNTKAEILTAMEDFQAGRFGQIPATGMPHRHPGDVHPGTATDDS